MEAEYKAEQLVKKLGIEKALQFTHDKINKTDRDSASYWWHVEYFIINKW